MIAHLRNRPTPTAAVIVAEPTARYSPDLAGPSPPISASSAPVPAGSQSVLRAEARFTGPREVMAGEAIVRPQRVVVATGCEPYIPNLPGSGSPRRRRAAFSAR
jgi:hypothetical protein